MIAWATRFGHQATTLPEAAHPQPAQDSHSSCATPIGQDRAGPQTIHRRHAATDRPHHGPVGPALRPTRHPHHPDQARRRNHPRRPSLPPDLIGRSPDARTHRRSDHRPDRSSTQHGDRCQPNITLATPGQRPNQPITASRLRTRLRRLGITGAGRVAAFNELLREIPAPVLADLVGCHPRFAAERASALATDWDNYAALRARSSPSTSPTTEDK
jgi:hypothetical protein